MANYKRCPVVLLDQQRETCVGLIQCIKDWKSFILPEEDFKSVGELSFGKNISDGVFEFWQPKALYILSNNIKDIKDGDYVYVDCSKNIEGYKGTGIWKYSKAPCPMPYWGNIKYCKKIIATTDESLNLPCPSKSFVMKYIYYYNICEPITHVLVAYDYFDASTDYYDNGCGDEKLKLRLIVSAYDNTVTIRSIKNNYTENELINTLNGFAKSIDNVDKQIHPENYVDQWLDDNVFI
jgi:predicted RNA-binding protein with PUA-like domain